MAKKKYFLSLYNEFMQTGFMRERGLCNCIDKEPYKEMLKQFSPQETDLAVNRIFWAYEFPYIMKDGYNRHMQFTPLRQTILLFCAALNNEL